MTQVSTHSSAHEAHPGSGWTRLLWAVWIVLLVAGLVGLWQRFTYGHEAAGYGSYVPWGLWITLYFMGVAIAGGSFVFGAAGYLFGWTGFDRKADLRLSIVLSLSAILPAFMIIWLDLGRMDRLLKVFFSPTFTSMIAFNAWMYSFFLLIAVLCWLLSFKTDSVWLRPLLYLGGLVSLLIPSQSGFFFAAIGTKEYWNSPLLSVMFLCSALAAGAGTLLLIRTLLIATSSSHDGREAENDQAIRTLRLITVAALILYLVFEFAGISFSLWRPSAEPRAIDFLIRGDYWWVFWVVQLLIGAVIPLALYLLTESRGAWAFATMLLVLGFAAARMGILVPGQVIGQIPGLQQAFQDVRLTYSYHATSMEFLIGALMIAVGMAIFFIGRQLTFALASQSEQKA